MKAAFACLREGINKVVAKNLESNSPTCIFNFFAAAIWLFLSFVGLAKGVKTLELQEYEEYSSNVRKRIFYSLP